MLFHLSLYLFVHFSLGFNFPDLDVDFRLTLPVDTCVQNVSYDSGSYDGGQGGSMICRCNEVKNKPTQSTVMCLFYENDDCTGTLDDEQIWGGCVDDEYLYYVENCSYAQEAALDGCDYWVSQQTGQPLSGLNQVVAPLYQCLDYNCDGGNSDEDTQSCRYTCTSNDRVQESSYSTYDCEGAPSIDSNFDFSERVCINEAEPGCGVRVTRYQISSGNYNCGSKKSPFKTNSGNGNTKYFMSANQVVPVPIGACFETRNGFYSYSYKYECEVDDTGISTVMKYVYLGSSSCKGSDFYNSENFTSVNYTVSCSGSNGKGSYGLYASCSNNNWDAYYQDTPMLFGECVPFMLDPDNIGSDNGKIDSRPWNQNLRVVFSCNLRKRYLSAYFYVTDDCSGDYLFYWDWDDYYSNRNSWGNRQCGRPEIKNCGNSADTAGNKIGEQLD